MNMIEKEDIFEQLSALVLEKELLDRQKSILNSVYKGTLKQQILNAEFGNFKTFDEKIWALRNNIRVRPVCKMCGGDFHSFGNRVRGFPVNCSAECVGKDQGMKEHLRSVFQKKYGVDHPSQIAEVKQKKKATVKSRYGADYTFQVDSIKEEIKKTNMVKYCVENCAQAEIVKTKIKATNVERYGVSCPLQNEAINEKSKLTLFQNYGVNNPLQSEVILDKIKMTNLNRYGVENVQQAILVKEKTYNTNLERYGSKYTFQNDDIKNKISFSNFKNYQNSILPSRLASIYGESKTIALFSEWEGADKQYDWKHEPCGTKFKSDLFDGKFPTCPKCKKPRSKPQQIIRDFLDTLNVSFVENDRSILKPRELDFWFPDHNLGIEVNGVYWHRDGFGPGIVEKTKKMEELGHQVLHFWDFEILEKLPALKNVILSKLKLQKKIMARKCEVKEISSKESRAFLSFWHLSDAAPASFHYGLYYEEELVGVAAFAKNRFSQDGSYEVIRFACANVTIVGGLSKLINHAHFALKFDKLISFADRRLSIGNSYNKIGWQLEHITSPNYFYFSGLGRLSRQQAMKHKLPKLLGKMYNEQKSERENMILAGWIKCSDAGNLKFFKLF